MLQGFAPGALPTRSTGRGDVQKVGLRYKMTAARKQLNPKGILTFLFRLRYKMSGLRNPLF
jgi:hypothetical protein